MIETAYRYLFIGVLITLALCMILALVRAITGRRTVDRIMGINMISTMTVVVISVLAVMFAEDYLADISLIYVMLSFIATLLLCKLYITTHITKGGGKK